jgi:beta-xylosidase
VKAFGAPLHEAVASGVLDVALIDTALRRVLRQKAELGLLDADWSPVPAALAGAESTDAAAVRGTIDLDPPANRELASELEERAIVLVRNDGTLPLAATGGDTPSVIAVIGPNADDPYAMLGCYSFPTHVVSQHPGVDMGIRIPTLLDAIRAEFPASDIRHALGTTVDGGETSAIREAAALAASADVVVLALGDRAGLFGRGTSGEGCDAESLDLPGAQQRLVDAVLDTGTPTVLTLLAGRPYALGRATNEAAGIVQAFFTGEEGAGAIAGVMSGRVDPSGRLPVSIPSTPGSQPTTYLAAPLARDTDVSNVDPTAAFPFGHGLGYTTFEWSSFAGDEDAIATDGAASVRLRLRNTGSRTGTEVVQLYLHDPVASVVRPVQRLIGFARVELPPGGAADVRFTVPADLASFTSRSGERIVEPGDLVLSVGRSSDDLVHAHTVRVEGPARVVDHTRRLHPLVDVDPAAVGATTTG